MKEPRDSTEEPSRIRFKARDRFPVKGNPRASLWTFVLMLILLTLSGFRGCAMITEFLRIAQRPAPAPRGPEPVSVEFK
ncbi:MAG: hypothetical protein ACKO5K_09915 [Armatimonadota bacterium]